MALYTFEHNDTEEQITLECKIDDYDNLKQEMIEQGYSRVFVPLRLVDGATGDMYSSSDNGWKQVLNRIKNGSGKRNTIPSTGVSEI